jgi:hypothetical protein
MHFLCEQGTAIKQRYMSSRSPPRRRDMECAREESFSGSSAQSGEGFERSRVTGAKETVGRGFASLSLERWPSGSTAFWRFLRLGFSLAPSDSPTHPSFFRSILLPSSLHLHLLRRHRNSHQIRIKQLNKLTSAVFPYCYYVTHLFIQYPNFGTCVPPIFFQDTTQSPPLKFPITSYYSP